MLAIDKILEILGNGEWHELTEVARKIHAQKSSVELISSFLATYDFLQYDKKSKSMKLSDQLQLFLKKIKEIEREEAAEKRHTSVTGVLLS